MRIGETVDKVGDRTVLFVDSLHTIGFVLRWNDYLTMPSNKKLVSKMRQIFQWILVVHVVRIFLIETIALYERSNLLLLI